MNKSCIERKDKPRMLMKHFAGRIKKKKVNKLKGSVKDVKNENGKSMWYGKKRKE